MIIELPNDYLTDRELELLARSNELFAFAAMLAAMARPDLYHRATSAIVAACFVERAITLREHAAVARVTS